MKNIKQILSAFLLFVMLMFVVSCNNDGAGEVSDTNDDSVESTDNGLENTPPDEDDELDIGVPTTVGGTKYKSTYDAYDNTTMLFWDSVTVDAARSYGSELSGMGYTVYQNTDNSSIWSTAYTKDEGYVHVYYLKKLSEFRVLVSDSSALPQSYTQGEPLCNISVTQLGIDEANPVEGMGYIIRLEDESFVIVDGGSHANGDATELYNRLAEMNGAKEKITVRAWFFTHSDLDHYGVLMPFMEKYSNVIDVEMIVANDAHNDIYSQLGATAGSISFSKLEGKFGGAKYVKAHTGQAFNFAGLQMNILYTHEDANHLSTTSIHSRTSMVFDAVFGNERIIWLGDIEKDGAEHLVAMYGDDLACTMLQITGGATMGSDTLYKKCAPQTLFYAASKSIADTSVNDAKDAYIIANSNKVVYSYEKTMTMNFSDEVNIDGANGSVDENQKYTENY